MRLPSSRSDRPPSSAGVMKKPMASMKTMENAVSKPSRLSGTTTRAKACAGVAPSTRAARTSPESISVIAPTQVTICIGSST